MKSTPSNPQAVARGAALFSWLLLGAFVVLGTIGLVHHAMWRDEVFPWLLARDSGSLPELFRNLRYDGPHLAAWHLILWVASRWTHNIAAEQVIHLLLASTAVWLFVRWSPFNWKHKLLFGFGYFALYEYCVICRVYVLVWLCMFLFCAAFASRQKTYWRLAVILFVLTNTTMVGIIMAVALGAGLVAEFVLSGQQRAHYERRRWDPVLASSVFAVGVFLALVQTTHKAQNLPAEVLTGWWGDFHHTPGRLADALQNVWNAYVPLPKGFPYWPEYNWGSNMFSSWYTHCGWVFVVLSVILVVASAVTLIRSPVALVVWGVGLSVLLAFQTVTGQGALRHSGFLFILYVVCRWLERDPDGLRWSFPELEWLVERWGDSFLTWILLIQAVGGVYAWSIQYDCQFSGGKAAAVFIKAHNFQDLLLLGTPGNEVMPVAAYLDKDVYYLDSGRFGGFHVPTETNAVSSEQVLIDAPKLVIASNTDALLIINVPVSIQHPGSTATPTTEVFRVMGQPLSSNQPAPMVTFTLTNRAERCTVTSEMLYLYLIRRDSAGEGKEGGPTGQGTAVWPDGKVYVGEMKAGHPDGQGTMTWRNGTKYVGDFKEGLANGRGTLTLPDGKVQDGLWKRGQFAGAAE